LGAQAEGDIDEAWSTHRRNEKWIWNFSQEIWREETT